MAQEGSSAITGLLREPLGNIVLWSAADKCLLGAGITLFFVSVFLVVEHALLAAHPDIAPYINAAYLAQVFWAQMVVHIGGWVTIVVAALVLRHRSPNNRMLVHATVQLFAVSLAWEAYNFGTHTTGITGVVIVTGVTFGLALFEPRSVWLAAGSFFAIVTGTTLAEQAGLIRYAPFLLEAPFQNGHLARSWLATLGGATFVLTVYALAIVGYVSDRSRRHAAQLALTTDQLARANELISRYVAQQVTEQIRLGNYDAVDRQSRRRLTLFFSDIKGFTEVADHIEAEELSEILNEYFTEMTRIAERFGGTIDKFMGDAIMIFFGAPVATHDGDHALRAVRMAMAMQGRMKELDQRWEKRGIVEPFVVRMGINTGVASVGNFGAPGRMDYTAIGRQVNLAARLQVNCDPGKILLSHATWVLVRDEIPCEPKGEIQVKGIRDPVNVYEVTAPYPIEELTPDSTTRGAAA